MKRALGERLKRIGIWLARAAVVGVVVGVLLLVLLLVLLRRERNQSLELPIPTGPFAVGRATYVWSE